MRAFIIACIAAIVIAIAAAYVLNMFQEPASEAYMSGTSARL